MRIHQSRFALGIREGVCAPGMAKSLESRLFRLDLLQAFEIPQNHQDIPWKSLALEPHFFGKACKKLGGARPGRAEL
jgi:hypothetical protein